MSGKVGVVARREFLTTIRRPSYLIVTFGMPVFVLLYGAFILLIVVATAKSGTKSKVFGIVDHSGLFPLSGRRTFSTAPSQEIEKAVPPSLAGPGGAARIAEALKDVSAIDLEPFATREEATKALERKAVAGFVEFPEDYLTTGRVVVYKSDTMDMSASGAARQDLIRRFVVDSLLVGRLEPVYLERVRHPIDATTLVLGKTGRFEPEDLTKMIGTFVVPIVFTVLFFMSVMMSSQFLLQGVAEEKENRVIEVILSSIDSDGLLLGKLIGLGGAGLLQMAIWFGLAIVPAATLFIHLSLNPVSLAASFLFYLLGFLLIGVMMMGTGSLGQNAKESQQYGMMWSLFSVIPIASMVFIVGSPNGVFPRVLSFIPFTAPVTMFLRLNSQEPPPWWETLLVVGVLAISIRVALRLMARIFRVGLLLYGKRPTIPEIFRLTFRKPV